MNEKCAIGVDLGGTKIEIAAVSSEGKVLSKLRTPTDVAGGPTAIEEQILKAVESLIDKIEAKPVGIGVGIAAQIDDTQGVIRSAPNLNWRDVPFQENLKTLTKLPVVLTNDVRAAAWGEWLYGAGKDTSDMICMFVGTGIGGGIVSGGNMLNGCSNTAGEVGHIVIRAHGPECHCGSVGCLEAVAGGWAIAERAKQAVASETELGKTLLAKAKGNPDQITTALVAEAFHEGDLLAKHLIKETAEALIDGCISLTNAFNPCRFIFGGGVIEGMPHLVQEIEEGVRKRALAVATERLSFLHATLGNDSGVIGAAALVFKTF